MERLSKSKYLSGLQCHKRLWLEAHEKFRAAPPSFAQKHRMALGTAVERLAQEQFPAGVLVRSASSNPLAAVKRTQQLLGQDRQTTLSFDSSDAEEITAIFEGAFSFDGVLVRTDILRKNADLSWDLIEVKSSSGVKATHLADLAVQKYVVEKCGLEVKRTFLMHVNKACRYPELTNLFVTKDLTDNVAEHLPTVQDNLLLFSRMLRRPEIPDIKIGDHCHKPYACPFIQHCWRDVPEKSIFTIPRLHKTKQLKLIDEGTLDVRAVPEDFALSEKQQEYVEMVRTGRPSIDHAAIAKELAPLEYPCHFLDFETDTNPVPRFHGVHPFQQIPFQYSCHILDDSGRLTHFDYVHTGVSDPREALLKSLLEAVGSRGSVIGFNTAFEKRVLHNLAEVFPAHSSELESIVSRLWDQLTIFKNHYKHPAFKGSNSIKHVLPIMVPSLSYADLNIQRGDEAAAWWNQMIHLPPGRKKNRIIRDLKIYGKLDTLAMVEIYKALNKIKAECVRMEPTP